MDDDQTTVSCVLCERSDETKITGALSTKDEVTAHQNCLLFSSGIFCRNSPQFDDLFGFSVEDVMEEVKRGGKLICKKCKKKGATAGCEVKRCKKSYHYPCAVQEGAKTIEDADNGKYGLYCLKHYQQIQGNNSSVNGCASSITKPQTSKTPSEAGPSKVYCLVCERTEGNVSLENLTNSIFIYYCDKHAPSSHKRNTNGDSAADRRSSDSSSSSSMKKSSSKRQLSFTDKKQERPSKRKCEKWKGTITDDSSDSDEHEPDIDMAPLESDLEESAEFQLIREDTESPAGSPSGNQQQNGSKDGNIDEDETQVESESLLPPVRRSMETQTVSTAYPTEISLKAVKTCESSPVHSPDEPTAGPSVPQQSFNGLPPSPDHIKPHSVIGSPPRTSSAVSPAPPETFASPAARPSHPEPSIDSASFWKSCNAAGCTQAIFTDFNNKMKEISSRIQSGQASQEDYDLALKVMEASGKLAELVTKQQKELQRKQMELEKVAAAMKEVVSALRR